MEFLNKQLRFSFKLNGVSISELPYTVEKTLSEGVITTEYIFDGGLKITNVAKKYEKYGAYEWVNYIENTSEKNSGVLTELYDCDVTLPIAHEEPLGWTANQPSVSEATKIYAPCGSTWAMKEFHCDVDELVGNCRINHLYPGKKKSYCASGGRSSENRAPFFNVHKNGQGYIFAIGWTGQWQAQIERTTDTIRFASGIEDVAFYLEPHEKIRTSSIVIMPYECDYISSQNKWRRLVREHFSHIGAPGRDDYGPLCANVWGGMKTDAVLERINRIKNESLPFEYVWMDAGWYGENTQPTPDEFEGDWGEHTGDWTVSPYIHTRELRDVSDAVHQAGMKFILWFEPERVIKGTPITRKHPEYFLEKGDNKNLLLDLGNEDAWQYCYQTLSNLIEQIGVDGYRQDFNMSPLSYWRKNDSEHRNGIKEIKHIDGLYRLWDALLDRFPNLLIDNCASGGRRIDIEMMRRSIPLWRSDYQCPANYDIEAAQIHNQTFNTWMPYSGTGTGRAYDAYRVRSAYGASLATNWSFSQKEEFANTDEKVEFIRKYTNEYLKVRPYFSEDFYPLTEVSTELDTWCASQFDRPSHGDGMLLIFRREKSPYETAKFALHAIDPNASYEISDLDGDTWGVKGSAMLDGFSISIPRRSAKILLYKKCYN